MNRLRGQGMERCYGQPLNDKVKHTVLHKHELVLEVAGVSYRIITTLLSVCTLTSSLILVCITFRHNRLPTDNTKMCNVQAGGGGHKKHDIGR